MDFFGKYIQSIAITDVVISTLIDELWYEYDGYKHNIYLCKQGLEQGEATFNGLSIFPFLKVVTKAVVEESDSRFQGGRSSLKAMTKQFNDQGGFVQYKPGWHY